MQPVPQVIRMVHVEVLAKLVGNERQLCQLDACYRSVCFIKMSTMTLERGDPIGIPSSMLMLHPVFREHFCFSIIQVLRCDVFIILFRRVWLHLLFDDLYYFSLGMSVRKCTTCRENVVMLFLFQFIPWRIWWVEFLYYIACVHHTAWIYSV
jgi:hypothetical protein